jgi:hypothetical protein
MSGLLETHNRMHADGVEVVNDTTDRHRYFDCMPAAEFFYAGVARTALEDMPRGSDYLGRHDKAMRRSQEAVGMPDRAVG